MNKEGLKKLEVAWDKKDHIYKIKNTAKEEVEEFILANTSWETANVNPQTGGFDMSYEEITEITSDEKYKEVYKKRTNLNNKAKEIDKKSKQAIAIMINDFQDYYKSLVSQIKSASNKLTKLLNDYKPREKTTTTKVKKFVIKISSQNKDDLQEFEELALSRGLEIETMEE